jgi:hypothetical protein
LFKSGKITEFMKNLLSLGTVSLLFILVSCSGGLNATAGAPPTNFELSDTSSNKLTAWMTRLYDRVAFERLSPPVASRIYAYASVAFYEAVAAQDPTLISLAGKVNELPPLPQPGTGVYDYLHQPYY